MKNGYVLGGWLNRAVPESMYGELNTFNPSGPFDPPSGSDPDECWMHVALLEAMTKIGISSPNPSVGALFVKDGRLISKGATRLYGGLHGERDAICKAKSRDDLVGSTAYVLLEPCAHTGKQPPCVAALIEARIARCVIAVKDPSMAGKGIRQLQEAGIEVSTGPLAFEAIAWNYPFFASHIFNRPLLIGKWAQTLDGHLADDEGSSRWISGPTSRAYTHWLRQKYDAIMIGAGTLLVDFPSLNVRDSVEPVVRNPLKIIFDPNGRVLTASEEAVQKLSAQLFNNNSKVLYGVKENCWQAQRGEWFKHQERGQLLPILLKSTDPLTELIDQFSNQEITDFRGGVPLQSVFIEGGSTILTELIRRDRLDAFHTFLTPGFIGGSNHRIGRITSKSRDHEYEGTLNPLQRIGSMKRYHLLTANQLGNDVLMEYLPEDRFQHCFTKLEK